MKRSLHLKLSVAESLNYSLKKPLRTRGAFPSKNVLAKVLYLALQNASKRWSMLVRNWKKALNWFAQLFGAKPLDRLGTQNPDVLTLGGVLVLL